MKKSLFYSLLTTATLLSPIFAFPSWAKNCPEIPKDTTEITVKIDSATLRTEADKSSEKGFKIAADDKLKVLDHKSTVDKTGQEFCWYKVSAVKDTDNKPYFIADVGIKKFPFSNSFTGSNANASTTKNTSRDATSGQHSNSSVTANNKGTSGQNGVVQEKLSQDVSQQKWLTFVVIGISIGNIIILLLVCVEVSKVRKHLNIAGIYRPSINPYKEGTAPIDIQIKDSVSEELASVAEELKELKSIQSIQRKLKRIQDDLGLPKQDGIPSTHEKLTTQERLLQEREKQLTDFLEMLHRIGDANQSNQDEIKVVTRRVENLEYNQQKTSGLGNQEIQETALTSPSDNNDIIKGENESEKTEYHAPETSSLSSQESSDPSEREQNSSNVSSNSIKISSQLQEIIDRFNQQRPELFRDFASQPLTLIQQSIDGKPGLSGSRILRLEIPTKDSQADYLKFEMDNASWLIPNIKSIHISKIMGNLGENSDIFTILPQGSGSSLQLIKPAKLKVFTDNLPLWEIEEPGEFKFRSGRVESLEYNRQNTSSLGDQEIPLNPNTDNFQSNYSFDDSQSYNQPDEVKSCTTEISHSSGQISSKVTPTPITIFSQLKEIIDHFNQQRFDQFRDSAFQPLSLTQDSIRSRILQLEVTFDASQATYLKFEIDNESWLIPNISSIHYRTIIKNLGENSDIFTIRGSSSSGSSPKLIMPAKLKAVSNELWEIEEPGEFQL